MSTRIRMKAGHALDLFRHVATDRLESLAVAPQELMAMFSSGNVTRSVRFYRDQSLTGEVDLSRLNVRLVVSDPQNAETTALVGIVELPGPAAEGAMAFMVTPDGEVFAVVESDSALHPDGVVQISGAEPMLTMLSARDLASLRAEGGPFVPGGRTIRSFWFEERGADQMWRRSNKMLVLPASAIESVEDS